MTTILEEVKGVHRRMTLLEKTVENKFGKIQAQMQLEELAKLKQHLPSLQPQIDLPTSSSPLPHQAEPSVSKRFRLCFRMCFKDDTNTIFTKDNIEDQGVMLELELCDDTGKRLEQVDPDMMNLKVMISVLSGFKFDDSDNFTVADFDRHVALPRKGKPPILNGNYEILMTNGYAGVQGISIMDSSRIGRSDEKFKLGAKVIKGLPFGSVVRPAVTEAFQVKDHRGKDGHKHTKPSPYDDISRLRNISKKGKFHKRAENINIKTVLDFLQLYNTDAKKLKDDLGLTGKKWTDTVKNAKACKLTKKLCKYRYRDDASGDVLLLKCDFEIESVAFRGQKDKPYESLTEFEKEKACTLRQAAYEKRGELEKIDAISINQIPVQDSPECSYEVERLKQQQAASTLPQCSNPSAYMHLSTTVTDHDNCQQGVINSLAFSSTGSYRENHPNVEIGNMTQQVANDGFAASVPDSTLANQAQIFPLSDINHQGVMSSSTWSSPGMCGSTCWGQTQQLNEPLFEFLMTEPEKTWPSFNQTSVHRELNHLSGIIQQDCYQENQQQQVAKAAPDAATENLNASSHESNQRCSGSSPLNPLPVDLTPLDQGNMYESSPGNAESLKRLERLDSINFEQLFGFHPLTTPPQEERSNGSARTSKLIITAHVVTATLFLMSIHQNPASASPMKKRKLR